MLQLDHRTALRQGLKIACASALALVASATTVLAEFDTSPAAIDFGRVRQQQVLSGTFKLTNKSDHPVEIYRVGADCSCTAATPDVKSLEAGQSTEIKVRFETRSYNGEVTRRVLVQTSDGDVMMPVKAVVSAYDHWTLGSTVAIVPASRRGDAADTALELEYVGPGQAEVKEVTANVPWLKTSVVQKGAGKFSIKLLKTPDAPAGNHQPRLTILTSDAQEPSLTAEVFASVFSPLNVNPSPVLLPPTKVGQKVSLPVQLTGWQPSENPRGELEGGEVVLSQRDRTDVLLSLSAVPKEVGAKTRLLRIYAGDTLEAEIPVIVRGE